MARLAEFIGGVHFEGRRNNPNEDVPQNGGEESQQRSFELLGSSVPLEDRRVPVVSIVRAIDSGTRSRRNQEPTEDVEQNLNPISQFRIRTLGDRNEPESSSSETQSLRGAGESSPAHRDQRTGVLSNPSNASSLVDIIQLLGSVARSGTGGVHVRGSVTRTNDSSRSSGPTNQAEDPRVPPGTESSRSPNNADSFSSNPLRSVADNAPSNSDDEENEDLPRSARRSQLGQQGFIIFPPDPLNAGGGPSILYFGGSGLGERGVVPDTVPPEVERQSSNNPHITSSAPSRSQRNAPVSNSNDQYFR